MTDTEIKEAGYGQGFADACDWIEDIRDGSLVDSLRAALKPGQLEADEGLINALTREELADLVGVALRDDDGGWTHEAWTWFAGYNAGWRSAIEDRLMREASL
jgi:hypothetical protein